MRSSGKLMMVVAVGALAFAGCSDDSSDDSGSSGDGDGVGVVLSEFVIEPDVNETDAGNVVFATDNQGSELHEFVVAKGENAEALPTDADGAVDESQFTSDQLIGEIEDIESGASPEATFDLEAGNYVLFCNIVEEEADGTIESHFVEGMHANFTVN